VHKPLHHLRRITRWGNRVLLRAGRTRFCCSAGCARKHRPVHHANPHGQSQRVAAPTSTACPRDVPGPPSTSNARHQQQLVNLNVAPGLSPRATQGNTLVMRSSPQDRRPISVPLTPERPVFYGHSRTRGPAGFATKMPLATRGIREMILDDAAGGHAETGSEQLKRLNHVRS